MLIMEKDIEFLSVFKIEEKPILKPCLSDDRREEIRRIKAKALEIERCYAEKKKNPFIDDNIEKFALDIENDSIHSGNNTDNDIDNLTTSISEWDVSSIPGTTDYDTTKVNFCSETVVTEEHHEHEDDASDQSENTFVKGQLPQPIIRSDSFTVDEPSTCFLKHLEDNGVSPKLNSTSITDLSIKRELNETKVVAKETTKRKPECKKVITPKQKKYPTKLFGIKKGRVSSENISNLPEKVIRKSQCKIVVPELRKDKPMIKSNISSTVSTNQARKTSVSQPNLSFTQSGIPYQESTNETSTMEERNSEMMAHIEEKYRTEIVLFLEKQKREQDAFLRKVMSQIKQKQDIFQQSIVLQLSKLIDDIVSNRILNQRNISDPSDNSSNTMNDLNGNVCVVNNDDCKQTQIINAASVINAFSRGYLTRRLFKTQQLQQIIKIIRDSRDLVIDLHEENIDDDQLKHNLLLQLRSNQNKLSDIFNINTIDERMKMIAFDRQMIKFRLLQSNVRNNNNCMKESSSNIKQCTDSSSLENKLKQLKIVKLFSDSIPGYEEMACSNK